MKTEETKPEDFTNKKDGDHSHIKGWGIDADPKNDPTYPMKKRTDEEHEGYTWERPQQQPELIEVLRSVERPNLTAVFGTSVPPSGLSGKIRRQAFKKSESSLGRWMPLIMADRINEIEGIIDDLKKGHIPNLFAEKGWNAELKYNKSNFLMKVGAAALVTGLGLTLFLMKNGKNRNMLHRSQ